jgi:hypothetical protein
MAETSINTVTTKVRMLINDALQTSQPGDIFTYENTRVFTLTEANVVAIVKVYLNDIETTAYDYDETTNKVTFEASLTMSIDDVVEIVYTYYANYSDAELASYIQSSIMHLSMSDIEDWTIEEDNVIYPEPNDREVNLIALVAAILINPQNTSIRLPDISITGAKDLSTMDKVTRLIANYKKNTGIVGVFDMNRSETIF